MWEFGCFENATAETPFMAKFKSFVHNKPIFMSQFDERSASDIKVNVIFPRNFDRQYEVVSI